MTDRTSAVWNQSPSSVNAEVVEELRRREALADLVRRVAVAVNAGETLDDAFREGVVAVAETTGWPLGHVYLTADDGSDELTPSSIWYCADVDRYAAFIEATGRTRLSRGIGLPGRVVAERKPARVAVTDASSFVGPRRSAAIGCGLRTAHGFPVAVGSEVVAVLEYFTPDDAVLRDDVLAAVDQIAIQLGRAIERDRAESALRRSQAHYRAIVETANDAFVSVTPAGVIVEWNREAERVFGWSRSEAVGRLLSETVAPERFRAQYRAAFAPATGNSRPVNRRLEVTALDRRGREFPIELTVWSVWAGGETINAFLRDLSRRRELEQQLLQSQKLEAVGQLAGGVAHDFQNLLTVIRGYCDLLLRQLDGADPLVVAQVEAIGRATEDATAVTRKLLAFSRREVLQPQVIDLNDAIANALVLLSRLLPDDIQTETRLDESALPVRADPTQINQLLLNLAVNARDAMPDGGRIVLETSKSGAEGDERTVLIVEDTGMGMSAETKTRIFEPFFTTKDPGRGTGLGLSTVYGIVEQNGGTIDVTSAIGEGTRFEISFPAADAVATPLEREPASELGGNETVLLVEDQQAVRSVVEQMLGRNGYRVLVAATPSEALEHARAHAGSIDLLVTDVVMPEMHGTKLARLIAELRPEAEVLYMSGFTDDALIGRGVPTGEVAFLQKPFSPAELCAKVREVLDHSVVSSGPETIPTSL